MWTFRNKLDKVIEENYQAEVEEIVNIVLNIEVYI